MLSGLAGIPLASFAESETWGVSGNWQLSVDALAGNGCFMERQFDDGIMVRLGNLPQREGYFLAVLSQSWIDIVEGETAGIDVDFTDDLFAGEAVGIVEGEWHGGHIFFNNPEFLDLFARSDALAVGLTGQEMFEIPLDGTSKALVELRTCQKSQALQEPMN